LSEDIEQLIERLRSITPKVAGFAIGPGTDASAEVNKAYDEEYHRIVRTIVKQPGEVDLIPPFISESDGLRELFEDLQLRHSSREPRRRYLNSEFDAWRARRAASPTSGPPPPPAFDWAVVQRDWERAVTELQTDPANAMTSAVSALESILKHSIEKSGETWSETDKLPELWAKVRTAIRTSLPSTPRSTAFLRALDGLSDAVASLGTLRNKAGSAHGRGMAHDRASRAEASLVVYSAGAVGRAIRDAIGE
jgi:hypothetical protein